MRIPPVVRVAVSVSLIAVILRRVPASALWTAFERLDGFWLWPALATALVCLCVRTFKWSRLMRSAGLSINLQSTMQSLFGGFALGAVTPGRLGEFGRCLFLPKEDGGAVISLNVLDRLLDSWSVVTCAVVSLFMMGRPGAGIIASVTWLAFIPVVISLPRLVSLMSASKHWGKVLGPPIQFAGAALPRIDVVPFAGLALVTTLLDVATFFFLLRAFIPARFITAPATYPWIVMASGIPLSLGGLGLREGAATLALSHFSIPAAVATDVALILFAFLSLLPGLCGGLLLLLSRLQTNLKGARNNEPASSPLRSRLRPELTVADK